MANHHDLPAFNPTLNLELPRDPSDYGAFFRDGFIDMPERRSDGKGVFAEPAPVTVAKITAASEIVQQYGAEGVENVSAAGEEAYESLFRAAAAYLQGVFGAPADAPVVR